MRTVDYVDSKNKKHSALAFDNTVTIVEPKGSWFDPALLFAYAMLAALTYFAGTIAYSAIGGGAPAARNQAKKARGAIAKAATAATQPGPGGASTAVAPEANEWIDERHLKVRGIKKSAGAATSGSESDSPKKK